jgi:hypothetical protein
MTMLRARTLTVVVALSLFGCRSTRPVAARAVTSQDAKNQRARSLLCGDIGDTACLAFCSARLPPREYTECLLRLRFASDPAALELARGLYTTKNVLVGMDMRGTIEGYVGDEDVELFPALPLGDQRHHLEWVHASLRVFDRFVESVAAHAEKPVLFDPHPEAFVFFRTGVPSYPSAYASDGVIGYNLDGPLHGDANDVQATLVHELFHLNDTRQGGWSVRALGPLFDSIMKRCGDDHECFVPYAPFGTVVPGGTYYAFDARSADVREYAAELAVRYFLEHEAVVTSGVASLPPFKCLTEENRIAWEMLAGAFFGGVDLSPACDSQEVLEAMHDLEEAAPEGS